MGHRAVNVTLPADVRLGLTTFARRDRTSKSATVARALREFLRREGILPDVTGEPVRMAPERKEGKPKRS